MQGCVNRGVGAVWDEQAATKMVRAAVDRKLHLFKHFPDLAADDLTQVCLLEARKDFPKFDPAKSSFSTWIARVAGTTLIDAYRSKARRANRDGVYAAQRQTVEPPPQIDEPPEEQPLADWLHNVYLAAKKAYGGMPQYRSGRKFFSVGQVIAVAALMEKQKLTLRGCRQLFEEREDLRRAVHFWRVPKHAWFQRAREAHTEIREKCERSSGGE